MIKKQVFNLHGNDCLVTRLKNSIVLPVLPVFRYQARYNKINNLRLLLPGVTSIALPVFSLVTRFGNAGNAKNPPGNAICKVLFLLKLLSGNGKNFILKIYNKINKLCVTNQLPLRGRVDLVTRSTHYPRVRKGLDKKGEKKHDP